MCASERCSSNTRGQLDRTPLHQACASGHLDLVIRLVKDFRANVNARDSFDALSACQVLGRRPKGRTPLHLACIGGHVTVEPV